MNKEQIMDVVNELGMSLKAQALSVSEWKVVLRSSLRMTDLVTATPHATVETLEKESSKIIDEEISKEKGRSF